MGLIAHHKSTFMFVPNALYVKSVIASEGYRLFLLLLSSQGPCRAKRSTMVAAPMPMPWHSAFQLTLETHSSIVREELQSLDELIVYLSG